MKIIITGQKEECFLSTKHLSVNTMEAFPLKTNGPVDDFDGKSLDV
jgi:hypothetical protein